MHVIELRILRGGVYPGIIWTLNAISHVSLQDGGQERLEHRKGGSKVKMEAETAVMRPRPKESWQLLDREARDGVSPEPPKGAWPAALDFSPVILSQTLGSRL